MARVTAEITPGEVTQEQWDTKFDDTTKKLNDMGGAQTTDDLSEGASNKYDTGVPPADTDDLAEGAANKYDVDHFSGKTQDDLVDGTTHKQYSDTEKSKLSGIDANAKDDQTGTEMQTAIKALSDADREIMVSEPQSGEYKVYGAHRNAAGNLEYDYDENPES